MGDPPHARGPTTRTKLVHNTHVQRREPSYSPPTWEPTVPYTPPSESTVAQPNDQTRTDETPAHADSLIKRDVQLFVKRLRKDQDARGLAKIRYYLVGEYGDQTKRPHYHAAIFGEDFTDDRTEWRTSGDNRLYDRQD